MQNTDSAILPATAKPCAQRIPVAMTVDCVLLKGGHLGTTDSTDLLLLHNTVHRFSYPRLATRNTHGTGCTLSSAIAAELAKGKPLQAAVATAKAWAISCCTPTAACRQT